MLLKYTSDYENKKALRQQLFIFDEVSFSNEYEVDFKKVNLHRGMEHYDLPMRFAEVFLLNNSFSSIRGNEHIFSMLFPMEKVFEDYIEYVLENSKIKLGIKKIHINGKKGDWLLGIGDCKMINQQPDYLLEMSEKYTKQFIVCDAKWKLFDIRENESKGCKIMSLNSSDTYQIFSYLNYYENALDTAYIFAPKTAKNQEEMIFNYLDNKHTSMGKKLKVIPIDLESIVQTHTINLEIFQLVS
jgi:5-methylcytosine-specific restriction enzyme subunit McrC